jgi:UDP-N-acetylglucosamine 2-epimerase (hydrolysing)
MGELKESVFIIGSPDMDVMVSEKLPPIEQVKEYYGIGFENYALSIFHPVTTEVEDMNGYAQNYFTALKSFGSNYVQIYPNNDKGSDIIMQEVKQLQHHKNFKIFPSIRFEYFLTLLKHASFIIGNSSAGIREAPYYGVPTINVGTRQNGRSPNPDIINTTYNTTDILKGLQDGCGQKRNRKPQQLFGNGKSAVLFAETLSDECFWKTKKQKAFKDV